MVYEFDEVINRTETNSIKYNRAKEKNQIPLWVADMDFKAAPEIIEAIHKRVEHGIFGYSNAGPDYFKALSKWYFSRFKWQIQEEWIVKTTGVVFALANAIRTFTNEGDGVLIQQPVYHPFIHSISNNNRKLVNNPLIFKDEKYHIDFIDFEDKIINENVKLFLLCNPHNPVGRVFTKEELLRIGKICIKHGVIVVSDEIHADFIRPGHSHTIFANLNREFEQISITCTAPSKTFNLAGLQVSNIFIPNEKLRDAFKSEIKKTGVSEPNVLGLTACQAAYENGEKWLQELNEYIESNIQFVDSFLKRHIPSVKLIQPEGTYLLWLDFRELGMSILELNEFIENKAKLLLNSGQMFGVEGTGYQRMNVGCTRKTIEVALNRLKDAVQTL